MGRKGVMSLGNCQGSRVEGKRSRSEVEGRKSRVEDRKSRVTSRGSQVEGRGSQANELKLIILIKIINFIIRQNTRQAIIRYLMSTFDAPS